MGIVGGRDGEREAGIVMGGGNAGQNYIINESATLGRVIELDQWDF